MQSSHLQEGDPIVDAFWAGASQYVHCCSVRVVRITLKANCALSLADFKQRFGGTCVKASLVLRGPEMAAFLTQVTPHFDGATHKEAWARGVWAAKAIRTPSTIQLYDSRHHGLVGQVQGALLRRHPDVITTGNEVRVNISAKASRELVETQWMAIPKPGVQLDDVEKTMSRSERARLDMQTAKTPLDTFHHWPEIPVVWDSEEMHALVDAWFQKPDILELVLTTRPEGFEDAALVDVVVANIFSMCLNFRPIACFYESLAAPHVTYISMYVNMPLQRRQTQTMPRKEFAAEAVRVLLPHVVKACRAVGRGVRVAITLDGVPGVWEGPDFNKLYRDRVKVMMGRRNAQTQSVPVLATGLLVELDAVAIQGFRNTHTLGDVMMGDVCDDFKRQAKWRHVFQRCRQAHAAVLVALQASRFSGPTDLARYFVPVPGRSPELPAGSGGQPRA